MTESEFQQFKEFIDKLKYEILTLDDYETLFCELGGYSVIKSQSEIEWKMYTMCHNIEPLEGSIKLYFYPYDRKIVCYTKCSCSMDIIELVKKRFELVGEPKTLVQSVKWICNTCGIPFKFKDDKILPKKNIYNWKSKLSKYNKKGKMYTEELTQIDSNILRYFEPIYHDSWIKDNISIETMSKYEIGYYSYRDAITIPCYDDEGRLIGIRGRFLNPECEAKYKPIRMLNGREFKFPTGMVLYGYYQNKEAIKKHKTCVLIEAEKSVLQGDSYFGDENITVGLFGKAMSEEKRDLILKLGVNEVCIAIDFDYSKVGEYDEYGNYQFTEDFKSFEKNLYRIGEFFKGFVKVTALISYGGHKIHDSPTDNGKEFYLKLYKEREELY